MSARQVLAASARAFWPFGAANVAFIAIVALAAGTSACNSGPNPCPTGGRPRYDLDRCLPPEETSVAPSEDGGSQPSDPNLAADAGGNGDDATDGAPEAGLPDAMISDPDAMISDPDATPSEPDASPVSPEPDPSVDTPANDDAGDSICSTADLDAWRNFHVAKGLVSTLTMCLEEGCDADACPAIACTKKAANVQACDPCIDAEAQCLLASCKAACGEPGSDAECRACICEADCVPIFEACAATSFAVCTGVFGRDSTNEERVITAPILFKQKSATGFLKSAHLNPAPSTPKPSWTFTQHQSAGWTKHLAFTQGDRDYLLQYKGACAAPPCLARVSPVLSDGSLGRPVLETRWPAGIAALEVVVVQARVFIASYAPAQALVAADPGVLRVFEVIESAGLLELVPRIERAARSASGPWSAIEAFTNAGAVYVAFYDALSGEVAIDTAALDADALTLTEHARLQWESGLTTIETFSHASQTYLLTYQTKTGQARLAPFLLSDGKLALAPPLLDGLWTKGLTHIEVFKLSGETCLLRQAQATGAAEILRLGADASGWGTALGEPLYVDAWGKKPAWDLVSVAHAGKW